ncbi:nicotinate-nucleotide--dimethylbenzimidazole phosphoribosyltransferase [Klebsiella pneumoniae]|uniref:nicotinate-nucleotide--dimethylbenzimidazole phosphoribosyltransferase n=1 Tax=Klebsiella pneumoniae TaxID=573 RepID=UPI00388ED988
METLSALLAAIPQPDVAAMARAQQHIDGLLKPPGSLGRLESLAVQLAGLPACRGSWRWRRKRSLSCAPTMASGMKA